MLLKNHLIEVFKKASSENNFLLKENIVLKWVHRFGIDSLNDLLIHIPVQKENHEEENQKQITLIDENHEEKNQKQITLIDENQEEKNQNLSSIFAPDYSMSDYGKTPTIRKYLLASFCKSSESFAEPWISFSRSSTMLLTKSLNQSPSWTMSIS